MTRSWIPSNALTNVCLINLFTSGIFFCSFCVWWIFFIYYLLLHSLVRLVVLWLFELSVRLGDLLIRFSQSVMQRSFGAGERAACTVFQQIWLPTTNLLEYIIIYESRKVHSFRLFFFSYTFQSHLNGSLNK